MALPFSTPADAEEREGGTQVPLGGLIDTATSPQLALASIDASYESDDYRGRRGWMRTGKRQTPAEGSYAADEGAELALAIRFDVDEDHDVDLSLPPVEENITPYRWLLMDPVATATDAREVKEDEPMADYGEAPLPGQHEP